MTCFKRANELAAAQSHDTIFIARRYRTNASDDSNAAQGSKYPLELHRSSLVHMLPKASIVASATDRLWCDDDVQFIPVSRPISLSLSAFSLVSCCGDTLTILLSLFFLHQWVS